MKKIFVFLFAASTCVATAVNAQDQTTGQEIKQDTKKAGKEIKKDAKKAGHAVKKGATTAGNKTGEYAVKGAAKAFDKRYEGKTGPNGEKVYITADSRYYWVDKKGGRHFATEAELKDKTE
jgi:Ni/Co efflux regulator RcnB